MRKIIILFSICSILATKAQSQEYTSLMQLGRQYYNNQNYILAFEQFDLALESAKSEIEIKDGRLWKTNSWKNIRKEIRETEQRKKELKNSKEVIDALYFYGGKFALAYKDGRYGFIDKSGKLLIDYRYDNATPFDVFTGFAKVSIDKLNYLVDTTGREYLLAESSKGLSGDIEAIDLSKNNLTEIPRDIFGYLKLKILILSNNNLKKIPAEINRLTELVFLDVSGNYLLNIPPEIGSLKNLKYLTIRNNSISKLPNEISNLQLLEKIDISNNQLFKLPDGMASLYDLKVLVLDGNMLPNLSSDIGLLINLKYLSVQGNVLTNLPPEIGRLSRLKTLCISDNKITDLPAETGRLLSLTSFNISKNQLSYIPEEIKNLSELKNLDIRGNSLNDQKKDLIKSWLPNCIIEF